MHEDEERKAQGGERLVSLAVGFAAAARDAGQEVQILAVEAAVAQRLARHAATGRHGGVSVDGSILPRVELAATRTKEARCGYVTHKRPESGATLEVGRSYTQQ